MAETAEVIVDFPAAKEHGERMAAALDLRNGRIVILVRDRRLFRCRVRRKIRDATKLHIDPTAALTEALDIIRALDMEYGELDLVVIDGAVLEIETEPSMVPQDAELRESTHVIADLLTGQRE